MLCHTEQQRYLRWQILREWQHHCRGMQATAVGSRLCKVLPHEHLAQKKENSHCPPIAIIRHHLPIMEGAESLLFP